MAPRPADPTRRVERARRLYHITSGRVNGAILQNFGRESLEVPPIVIMVRPAVHWEPASHPGGSLAITAGPYVDSILIATVLSCIVLPAPGHPGQGSAQVRKARWLVRSQTVSKLFSGDHTSAQYINYWGRQTPVRVYPDTKVTRSQVRILLRTPDDDR
jgi:hypothetical protein